MPSFYLVIAKLARNPRIEACQPLGTVNLSYASELEVSTLFVLSDVPFRDSFSVGKDFQRPSGFYGYRKYGIRRPCASDRAIGR